MAKKNDTTFFENKLLDFVTAKDPLLEMLQWVMDKFMEIEVPAQPNHPHGIVYRFLTEILSKQSLDPPHGAACILIENTQGGSFYDPE